MIQEEFDIYRKDVAVTSKSGAPYKSAVNGANEERYARRRSQS